MRKHYNPVLTQNYLKRVYDSAEFTMATGLTNYDLRANESDAFSNLEVYTTISIRTDQNLTLRLNATTNSAITVISGRPFSLDNLMEITDIYLTNASGSTANVAIIGVQKE